MIAYWQQLSRREQVMLSVAGGFVAFAVFFYGILNPIRHRLDTLRQDHHNKVQLLAYMQSTAETIGRLQRTEGTQKQVQSNALISELSNSLKQGRLAVFDSSIRQLDSNQVQIDFKQVAFDDLLEWNDNLWRSTNIEIDSINITPLEKSGLVKATLKMATI